MRKIRIFSNAVQLKYIKLVKTSTHVFERTSWKVSSIVWEERKPHHDRVEVLIKHQTKKGTRRINKQHTEKRQFHF